MLAVLNILIYFFSVSDVRNYLEWLSNSKKSQLGLLEEKKTKSEREKKIDALCAIPGISQKDAEALIKNYGVIQYSNNNKLTVEFSRNNISRL